MEFIKLKLLFVARFLTSQNVIQFIDLGLKLENYGYAYFNK